MNRPSVRDVSKWNLVDGNDTAKVYTASGVHDGFFYKVTITGQRPKYFYGETAWSDAIRLANDSHRIEYSGGW